MATFSAVNIGYPLSSCMFDQSLSPRGILESLNDLSYGSVNLLDVHECTSPIYSTNHGETNIYNTCHEDDSNANQNTVPHRPWIPVAAPSYNSEQVSCSPEKITSNPLFTSLQSALQNAYTSLGPVALMNSMCASHTTKPDTVPLSVRIGYLQNLLMSADLKCCNSQVTELEAFYHLQSNYLESTRYNKLQTVAPFNPWLCASINTYYDNMHHTLISRILQSVDILQKSIYQLETPSETYNPILDHPAKGSTELYQDTAHKRIQVITTLDNPINVTVPKICHKTLQIKSRATKQCKQLFRRKGVLNPVAVRIMQAWYNNNSEHPYPGYDAAKVMAEAGDITVDQVKKWFANHRRRSNNTKPIKEIAQRRKVAKRSSSCMEDDDIYFTDSKKARDC